MGRLKRKRPASRKKKKRQAAPREQATRPDAKQLKVATQDVQPRPGPTRAVVSKKAPPKAIKPSRERFQPAFFLRTTQFLREVKIELKKVTWPSRKETVASTAVVLILVAIVSSFLGLVDAGLSTLIGLVIH